MDGKKKLMPIYEDVYENVQEIPKSDDIKSPKSLSEHSINPSKLGA